jgi:hypothetical protein
VKGTRRIRIMQGMIDTMGRKVFEFSKWFYLIKGSQYFIYFRAIGLFQLSKKTGKKVVGRRLPKAL